MEQGIGEFVVKGRPLASLEGSERLGARDAQDLAACYSFDRQRSVEQDAAFGVQQIVDIAEKALSPGINDSTTAVMCIDRLTEVLAALARRRIASPWRRDAGVLRVMATGTTFEKLADLAYGALRDNARGNRAVLARLLWSMGEVGALTSEPGRCRVLAQHAALAERELAAAAPAQRS